MSNVKMTLVRIYLMESSHSVKAIGDYLRKDAKIQGMTVLRAIDGFGMHSQQHTTWVDLSLDEPLIIEFMDRDDKAHAAMAHLSQWVKPERMMWWTVNTNV